MTAIPFMKARQSAAAHLRRQTDRLSEALMWLLGAEAQVITPSKAWIPLETGLKGGRLSEAIKER